MLTTWPPLVILTVSEIVVGDFARAWIITLLVATLRVIVYIFRLQRAVLQGLNFYIASAHGSEPIPCEHTSLFKLDKDTTTRVCHKTDLLKLSCSLTLLQMAGRPIYEARARWGDRVRYYGLIIMVRYHSIIIL